MEFKKATESDEKVVFKRAKTRIPPINKSLSILLTSLQGVKVTVELKSDIEVTGVIEDVDKDMNILLRNVTQSRLTRLKLKVKVKGVVHEKEEGRKKEGHKKEEGRRKEGHVKEEGRRKEGHEKEEGRRNEGHEKEEGREEEVAQRSSTYYITGSSIRYVQIPSEINAHSHLGAYMKQIDRLKGRSLPNKRTAEEMRGPHRVGVEQQQREILVPVVDEDDD